MRATLQQTIDGFRYNTKTATLIASNEYWDGHNWERGGTNLHLYRTPNGRYFTGYTTCWQGDRSRIEALSLTEATALYEQLPEHEEEYEDAFPGHVAIEA